MGCLGDREKGPPDETAKWDFITLSDFKCTSTWTYFAYTWLWLMTFVGVAVYVVDTYTAVNLLAFDHWSSQVQPALPFKYSKWIFAICILLSWVLCIYDWIRAIGVMRRGGVAESFLDPLSVTIMSIRPGGGFKRFLVFGALTKSKKGADYVALFVYFAFKGAIRVVLAEGPRQVVNGMTLWAVLNADLLPVQNTDRSAFDQFWFNVGQLAQEDKMQAATYCGMLFTLFIWVFSALSLASAGVLYLTFLWHYIPSQDGRLSIYCRRKVDKRLAKVVEYKVKAAIEKEEKKKQKAFQKAEEHAKKSGLEPPEKPFLKKQPTLPDISDSSMHHDDKLPEFSLSRQDSTETQSTLPLYSDRSSGTHGPLQRQPTLPSINTAIGGRPGMVRTGTQNSNWSAAPSYTSEAPLLSNAGYAGHDENFGPPPSAMNRQESYSSYRGIRSRAGSQSTLGSQRPFTPGAPGSRAQTPMSARPFTPGAGPPSRMQTPITARPYTPGAGPPPPRTQTPMSARPFTPGAGPPPPRVQTPMSATRPFTPGAEPPLPRMPPGPRYGTPMRSNTPFNADNGIFTGEGEPSFRGLQDRTPMPLPGPSENSNATPMAPYPPHGGPSFTTPQSQQSFSRPLNLNKTQENFSQPFTNPVDDVPEPRSPPPESFELKSNPTHVHGLPPVSQSNAGQYVPFNAPKTSSSPSPAQGDYVAFKPPGSTPTPAPTTPSEPQRNLTVPNNRPPGEMSNAHDRTSSADRYSAYASSILDEYASSDDESRRPSVVNHWQAL